MEKKLILERGKSCEKCIFFPLYKKVGNALPGCKDCEYKTLFPSTDYKSQNNKNKSRGILDKCKNCDYFSYKEGYKPHCRYNKKSPVIDDNFKCPKEIKE